MTAAKQAKPQVPLKDFYTIQNVAALIQVSENAVRGLAYRNLLPFGLYHETARNRAVFGRWLAPAFTSR